VAITPVVLPFMTGLLVFENQWLWIAVKFGLSH
jgi:hypothetical protein